MHRPFACTCGAAGSDQGELDDHLLELDPAEHWPVSEDHVTERVRAHVEVARDRRERKRRLSEQLGMSIDEIRDALR